MMPEIVYIVSYKCNDNLTLDIVFNDNTTQHIDVGGFIRKHPHPQHNKYLKVSNFRKCRLEDGNIVWGNDMEFHIESLYNGTI
jgi:hypothetical protein